jgi:hypothetical protein
MQRPPEINSATTNDTTKLDQLHKQSHLEPQCLTPNEPRLSFALPSFLKVMQSVLL